jgi:hypothetical protein
MQTGLWIRWRNWFDQAALPSRASLSFQSAGLGPSQMRSSALKNSGSLNGSPWGLPLTVMTVPVPGHPVDGEGVAGHQLLVVGKDLAHAQHAWNQLGESGLVHVVFHAARKQLAQLAGINVTQHDDVQSLGARGGQRLFGGACFFGEIQACGVHLEHGFVAHACAVELQLGAARIHRLVVPNTRHIDLRHRTHRQQAQHCTRSPLLQTFHACLLKIVRSFAFHFYPAQQNPQQGFRVRPKVSVRPARPFATLAAMFIHRTTITGLSDRGAWPWRKPDCVRT